VTPEFSLRAATEADLGTVLRLVRGLAEYEKLTDHCTATETDFHAHLFGPKSIAHAALAETNGQPVGLALWYYSLSTFAGRKRLFVEDVFVEPVHRGGGIGHALFRHMAQVALQDGCNGMEWRVLNWNQPAIDFYRRIGAVPVTDWTTNQLSGDALTRLAT